MIVNANVCILDLYTLSGYVCEHTQFTKYMSIEGTMLEKPGYVHHGSWGVQLIVHDHGYHYL